jgi:hypothetical protein
MERFDVATAVEHVIDLPDTWPVTSSVTCTVYSSDGSEKVPQAAATVMTTSAIGSAVSAGDREIVLASHPGTPPEVGDLLRIGDSSLGWTDIRVESYTQATTTVVAVERVERDIAVGSAVYPRSARFTTTVADAGVYTFFWRQYGGTGPGDSVPFLQLKEAVSHGGTFEDIPIAFAERYPRYETRVPEDAMGRWVHDAKLTVSDKLESRGRNLARLIDVSRYERAVLLQLAIMVCEDGGSEWAEDMEMLKAQLEEQITTLDKLDIWEDRDQDLSQDDGEFDKVSAPIKRNW